MKARLRSCTAVLVVVGAGALASACGGSKKQAQQVTPGVGAQQPPYGQAPAPQQPGYPQQQQPPPPPTPVGKLQMNASAQAAYQKGIAAYGAGDHLQLEIGRAHV